VFIGAGGDPWDGVRFALSNGSPLAGHGTDVTDTLDRGVASLREHRAYLEALSPDGTDDATTFLRTNAADAGPGWA
ncbi:MAG: PIG-L family deacetylase, partial [Acidimicrobiia bacterium]|nr:PIG-L family deacetylase [Acidimicrobiia bacterium]